MCEYCKDLFDSIELDNEVSNFVTDLDICLDSDITIGFEHKGAMNDL